MKKKFIKPVVMIGKIQTPTLCAGSTIGESTDVSTQNGGSLGSKGSFFDDEAEF